jgi:GH24 family phage-related lysozyme (muramidase)
METKVRNVKTRFLCETCTREVAFDAEVCPNCGTIFAAVKCPMCQFEGKISFFYNGCPQCHYHGESLSRMLNARAAKAARSTKTGKRGSLPDTNRKHAKKREKLTFSETFYLFASLFLAAFIIFLLFFFGTRR